MLMPTGIKGIINVMLLNHPQTIPHPKEGVVKNYLFGPWSQKLGAAPCHLSEIPRVGLPD